MLFSYTFRDRSSNMRWILPWTDIAHIQHIYTKRYKPMMIRAEYCLLNCADFIVNVFVNTCSCITRINIYNEFRNVSVSCFTWITVNRVNIIMRLKQKLTAPCFLLFKSCWTKKSNYLQQNSKYSIGSGNHILADKNYRIKTSVPISLNCGQWSKRCFRLIFAHYQFCDTNITPAKYFTIVICPL